MSSGTTTEKTTSPPSLKERITAIHGHRDLFEEIARYPQAGLHQTFVEQWAFALAFVESEVYDSWRAAVSFVENNLDIESSTKNLRAYRKVMHRHINCLLLQDQVVQGLQKSSCAPIPSKLFMQRYRCYNRPEKYGARAANGEPATMYGVGDDAVPSTVATADDEALEPLAQFIRDRLMDPVIRYILMPSKKLLHRLPLYERNLPGEDKDFEDVYEKTLNAIANVCVYVVATLILIAPIAIFDTVQQQTPRIVIVPLFCLLLAASAQLMGPGAMPLFTLVTSYFQTMAVFVAITRDK